VRKDPGFITWGFRSTIARNTLSNANATRDWRIYCDFAQSLIGIARRLYADEAFALDLKDTVYALDATTIDLCLSVFPWAPFRSTKAAIKLHTLLDLRGNIPSFILAVKHRPYGRGQAELTGERLDAVMGPGPSAKEQLPLRGRDANWLGARVQRRTQGVPSV
jgi:hypothetical protein